MNVGRHRDTILIVSFLTWCVLLSFPLMTMEYRYEGDSQVVLFQLLGAAQYLAIAIMLRLSGDLIGRYDYFQISIFAIIFLSLGLQLHDDAVNIAGGIAYTVVLIATMVALSLIYTMPADAVARCLGGAAVVFGAFGVTAVAIFGWPQNRLIGSIHPNFFGTVMLSAFIFSQFREGVLFLVLRIIAFLLAIAVSTRFALIGCLLAFLVFEITYNPFNVKLVLLSVVAAACFLVFHQQIVDVLALDDPARGVGSGFTGRDEEWAIALQEIADNPFGVGFKRQSATAAGHNGYLKILLEFGIIGGGLIIAAAVSIVLRALFEAIAGFREHSRLRRLAAARAGGLVALLFATFFQPQMLNLGDVHGISLMLLLFRPGRSPVRQTRLSSRKMQLWNGPARAPFSSPGDRK
jgi:O-antigen ligase